MATQKIRPDESSAELQGAPQRRARWNGRPEALALGAVIAVVALVGGLTVIVADGGAEPVAGRQPSIQTTPTPPPAVTTRDAYLLNLETGAETPLPEGIRGQRGSGYGYSISPDGSQVAYFGKAFRTLAACGFAPSRCSQVGIFVSDLDATNTRRITHGYLPTRGVLWPGWSPDGTKIAYAGRPDGANRDVNTNVFVVDVTSGATTQVTFGSVAVSGAQFSPDGSSIIYTAHVPGGSEVWRVPARGGEGSRLVGGPGSSAEGASLSPDGSLLSYTCPGRYRPAHWMAGESPTRDLCLASSDGSNPRVIAQGRDPWGIRSARWSPDGSRLAVWDFWPLDVRIIDVATGEKTDGVTSVAWPTWLDDRTLILEEYDTDRQ